MVFLTKVESIQQPVERFLVESCRHVKMMLIGTHAFSNRGPLRPQQLVSIRVA